MLGLSLIAAIGAQNAFVLRQGLMRQHVFAVALTCALSDALLIFAGVLGFGTLVALLPWLEVAMSLLGAFFLVAYAGLSFRAAMNDGGSLRAAVRGDARLMPVLLTCLALTWLNPHVYLDTVVLIGSVSTGYGAARVLFGLGAMMASFSFFFALGYGARYLAPLLAHPLGWRILEALIGVVMLLLAAKLVLGVI